MAAVAQNQAAKLSVGTPQRQLRHLSPEPRPSSPDLAVQEYIAASAQDEATGATRMATLLGSEMSTLSLTSASSASLTTFTIEPPSSVANSHWDAEEMADLDVDGHPADRQVCFVPSICRSVPDTSPLLGTAHCRAWPNILSFELRMSEDA